MTVPAVTFALPIAPEHLEGWRRFMQEISLSRRLEFERSRRQAGIGAERIWLVANVTVWWLDAEDPEGAILRLAASDGVFDRWFAKQVRELAGLELIELLVQTRGERMLEFQG
jgi:hypothetical protein